MHVHHHQALRILGEDVDALDLADGVAEGGAVKRLPLGGRGWGEGSLAIEA
jgi:hypothetical protein